MNPTILVSVEVGAVCFVFGAGAAAAVLASHFRHITEQRMPLTQKPRWTTTPTPTTDPVVLGSV